MSRDRSLSLSEAEEVEKMADGDDVICPYDDKHRVPSADYFLHVARCRKAHYLLLGTKIRLFRCTFNGRHLVPELERHMHEALCPDRRLHEYVVGLMEEAPVPLSLKRKTAEEDSRSRFDEDYNDLANDSHV